VDSVKITSIRQAIQHVADNPEMKTDVLLDVAVHELVARSLFEIANGVRVDDKGSLARANIARNMIFTRLVGRRRAGSHPATEKKVSLTFVDLAGELND
jgi:hypothetical protein